MPVRALRVTFVGELGWELYASSEYGAALWETVWAAGRSTVWSPAGYRAIDSMRLEKGYRVWGSDLTAETTPYEAGLGFCVKLDKPGGFEGRDALLAAREAGGPTRRLRAIVLDDPTPWSSAASRCAWTAPWSGGSPPAASATRSARRSPMPTCRSRPDRALRSSIDLFGRWVDGTVTREPLFDPDGARVRGG